MDRNKNTIDHLFQKGLQNGEATPSNKLWEGIEKQVLLDENKKNKRRMIYLFWWSTFVSAFLLLFSMYHFGFFEEIKDKTIASKDIVLTENTYKQIKKENSVFTNNESANDLKKKTSKGFPENENQQSNFGMNSQNSTDNQTQKPSTYHNSQSAFTSPAAKYKYSGVSDNKIPEGGIIANAKQVTDISENEGPIFSKKASLEKPFPPSNTELQLFQKNNIFIHSLSQHEEISPTIAIVDDSVLHSLNTVQPKKWMIGAIYSRDYSPSIFSNNPISIVRSSGSTISISKPKLNTAWSIGINTSYQLNQKWSIRLGLIKRIKSESISIEKTTPAIFNPNIGGTLIINGINTETYNSPEENPYEQGWLSYDALGESTAGIYKYEVKYVYNYLSIPVLINHTIQKGSINYILSSGLTTDYLLSIHRFGDINSGKVIKANSMKKMMMGCQLGAGMQYKFSPSFSVNVEPSFNLQFIGKSYHLKGYPYNFSLGISANYHF